MEPKTKLSTLNNDKETDPKHLSSIVNKIIKSHDKSKDNIDSEEDYDEDEDVVK